MEDFLPSFKMKIFQFVIIIAYFFQISSKFISNCTKEDGLKTENCFNNLIHINASRAGQFAEDKDQNMFVLYSSSSNSSNETTRHFFGLKKDGTNYFSFSNQQKILINPNGNARERKESRIIFVSSNDKEYLFSTSAGEPNLTLIELYNIENNNINSSLDSMEEFCNIDTEEITSCQYSLLKEPDQNNYFLAFTQKKISR